VGQIMKHYIIFFLMGILSLFSVSCTSENKKPAQVLEEEQMRAVIEDLLFANELYTRKKKEIDSLEVDLSRSVFKKHGIDSTIFYESLNYYLDRPETFMEIYKKIESDIKRKLDSMDKIYQVPRPKKDKKDKKEKKSFFEGIKEMTE